MPHTSHSVAHGERPPRSGGRRHALRFGALLAILLSLLTPPAFASGGTGAPFEPGVVWVGFFVLLLLAIAILPLVVGHWWESNLNKGLVAGLLSLPVLVFYLVHEPIDLVHSGAEYFSFIVLLWSLYTVSGGIVLRGDIRATPLVNTLFLATGAVIANIFGTTGAAMLLIRPLLRTNEERRRKVHIVIFFTFLVANVGGSLTPLGDPPLFLGFLRGVPFSWTLTLVLPWLFATLVLLGLFYVWDRRAYARERPEDVRRDNLEVQPLSIVGKVNFLFIAGILGATLLSEQLLHVSQAIGFGWGEGSPWRELIMIAMGLLSMRFTRKALRTENGFTFAAIVEVAVLFAGIFITMIPALALLRVHGGELGLTEPWQFLWASGGLSSFLDNAPTYLVFATTALSASGLDSLHALALDPGHAIFLQAVSVGAVFMGANTYIGNAPNFMVKVIADTSGVRAVRMPSFFGYMKYSCAILLPLYALVTLIFFVWFPQLML